MNEKKGILVIQEIPDEICKEKVKNFLLNIVKSSDREKIDSLLEKSPIRIGGKLTEDIGKRLAKRLCDLGAKAVFLEKDGSLTTSKPAYKDSRKALHKRKKAPIPGKKEKEDTYLGERPVPPGQREGPLLPEDEIGPQVSDEKEETALSDDWRTPPRSGPKKEPLLPEEDREPLFSPDREGPSFSSEDDEPLLSGYGEETPFSGHDEDRYRHLYEKDYHEDLSGSEAKKGGFRGIKGKIPSLKQPLHHWIIEQFQMVNKELWIILTMVAMAGLMNYLVVSQYMILGLYTFPTILSAYFFGRRHAVMTAFLTIIVVGIMVKFNNVIFSDGSKMTLDTGKWYHLMAWGSVLICTAYTMGTLYERHMEKVKELRKTYQGLIVILRHFISKDQYTENHCYRVSVYASKIAAYLGLDDEAIEDIRAAALLHDIGKLKVSRDLLYKAARLSEDEYQEIKRHVSNSAEILEPVKGPLGRIIPIILAHHDKYDGNGYRPNKGEEIPLGARILAVADVYDALTSDRPYRKAMAPLEVKEIIVKGAGKDFDPVVVRAFLKAFERGEMDVPNFVV